MVRSLLPVPAGYEEGQKMGARPNKTRLSDAACKQHLVLGLTLGLPYQLQTRDYRSCFETLTTYNLLWP